MNKKKIFVTGGAGYVGSYLVQELIEKGHNVTVYDTMFFGSDFFPKSDKLKVIKGDIRDQKKLSESCKDHEIFLHLACISNDASYELYENLSNISVSISKESLVLIMYLNFADLEGGLIFISLSVGKIGFFIGILKKISFCCFFGWYLEILLFVDKSLKKYFTILSSKEWNVTTAKIPSFLRSLAELIKPFNNSLISLLTNILNAWKVFVAEWIL